MSGRSAGHRHGRFGASHEAWHRRTFDRTGRRYPLLVVAGALALLHVVSLGATVIAAMYVSMAVDTFLLLLLVSQVVWALTNVVTWRAARRRVAAVTRWLDGATGETARADAWRAGVDLPARVAANPATLASAAVGAAVWDVVATVRLDLEWPAALAFFAGSAVAFTYWILLAFFHVEHGLRPVLERLGEEHGSTPLAGGPRLSLRRRMAVALPAINLVTGVAVAGLLPAGADGATGMAIGIATATVVTLTVSLWLTGLLSDSVVTPVGVLRDAAVRVGSGDLTTRVPILGTDETADLARAFNEMVGGLEQRDRLREAFGTFVDPDLADRVARDGVDLAGTEVDVSILFLDVRGFTRYAEEADARDVVGLLNRLFECVVPVVLEHGGHANKFVGDGLLAVFGAPRRLDDHAVRAVRAAAAIDGRVRETFGTEVEIGMGVHTGSVVAGTVGGGGRLDFTVIGDTVNTAARVEAATRQTGDPYLVTDATLERLPARDGWVRREAVLKGKREAVTLFAPAAAGESGAATGAGSARYGSGADG